MASNKVIAAGVGYTVGNILIRGIGFLTIPVFTRVMSTADYGLYNTYAAYEAIFYLFISLALNSSVKSAKMEFRESFDEYMASIVSLILANSLIWLVVLNAIYPLLPGYVWEYNQTVLNILVIHSCGSALLVVFNAAVSVRYQYKSYLVISLLNSVGSIVISLLLIYTMYHEERFMGRIVGAAAGAVFTGLIILFSFFRKVKPNFRKNYIKFALKYSLPVVPHGISQVILGQFDRIMIRSMVNEAAAGIYSFTGNISAIMKVIVNSVMAAWSPWFFEEYSKKNITKIRSVTRVCIAAFAYFTAGVMLCAPEVLKILSPRDYWEGISLVVPMALDVFCTLLYSIYCEIEYFYKKTQYLMGATFGAALINIAANYIMIKQYGYVMAAWTTLFSFLCYFSFHYLLSIKFAGQDVFCLKNNIPSILETILIAAFAMFFQEMWYVRWSMAVVLTAINAVLLKPYLVGFISKRRMQ